jgi:hypothetical protein
LIEARHDPELRVETVRYAYIHTTSEPRKRKREGMPEQPIFVEPSILSSRSSRQGQSQPCSWSWYTIGDFHADSAFAPKSSCGRRQEQDTRRREQLQATMTTTLGTSSVPRLESRRSPRRPLHCSPRSVVRQTCGRGDQQIKRACL